MPAATLARRAGALLAPLAIAAVLVAGCTSDAASPDGSLPAVPSDPPTVEVTDAPTTTQVPSEATPLVRQAVLDYWTALQTCQQRPSNCRPERFTAAQGTVRSDVAGALSTMVGNGWHRDTPSEADGSYVAIGAIAIGPDGSTATADECVYDATPLLDAKNEAVTMSATPRRITHTLYLDSGTWLVGDEQIDTTTACDLTPDSIPSDLTIPTT